MLFNENMHYHSNCKTSDITGFIIMIILMYNSTNNIKCKIKYTIIRKPLTALVLTLKRSTPGEAVPVM